MPFSTLCVVLCLEMRTRSVQNGILTEDRGNEYDWLNIITRRISDGGVGPREDAWLRRIPNQNRSPRRKNPS